MGGKNGPWSREMETVTENRRVRDVGEFGLIELLAEALPGDVRESADLTLGIGDDAAVWQPTAGEVIVVTTDSLVETLIRQELMRTCRFGRAV